MSKKSDYHRKLAELAINRYHAGCDPKLIELYELTVFPHLITAQPSTARKSRVTGMLLGRPTPRFLRRGRNIRYRLSDVLEWLEDADVVSNTAEASMTNRWSTASPV